MKEFKNCMTLSLIFCFIFLQAVAKDHTLISPNKAISFIIGINNSTVFYQINYKGKPVIDKSQLNLVFKEGNFTNQVKITKTVFSEGEEVYELVVGKAKKVSDKYRQLFVEIQQMQSPYLKLNIVIRSFNEGVAFRYEMPEWAGSQQFTLLEEYSVFNVAGDPVMNALFFPNYTSSHEGLYQKLQVSQVAQDTLIDLPALFSFPGNIFMAITEAALVDYAGMYLSKRGNSLVSKLSPLPGQTLEKVKASLPHKSPWRVMLISDRIGDLFESNMITSLNDPCQIQNTAWIKPGKTTFPWWNGNVLPDTINAPGNNFVTAKYYIDFCARNGLEYHSMVEYGLHQWYVDDGANFQPGPNADVTRPVPGLDMKEICDYAKSKGVNVRVWVHWAALYPKLDAAFALFEKWGLTGMMVDFMDRDDQEMVNIQNEILRKAATHKLHIQFHGAYKPTGLHRTWPNEFTREGTLNYECNKWAGYITPDMDIDIPFTRMLAGSTDYHLGGFRAVPASEIKPNYTRPLMLGTRCHMLAMYVVLENYLQMVCDYPEAYEGQPGFEFIKQIPTTWDVTKVIDAKPGEYIVMARKKDGNWYIGAITNSKPRDITLSFSFLGEDKFVATIYSDAANADSFPNQLEKKQAEIDKNSVINVKLVSGGGMVIQLIKR